MLGGDGLAEVVEERASLHAMGPGGGYYRGVLSCRQFGARGATQRMGREPGDGCAGRRNPLRQDKAPRVGSGIFFDSLLIDPGCASSRAHALRWAQQVLDETSAQEGSAKIRGLCFKRQLVSSCFYRPALPFSDPLIGAVPSDRQELPDAARTWMGSGAGRHALVARAHAHHARALRDAR